MDGAEGRIFKGSPAQEGADANVGHCRWGHGGQKEEWQGAHFEKWLAWVPGHMATGSHSAPTRQAAWDGEQLTLSTQIRDACHRCNNVASTVDEGSRKGGMSLNPCKGHLRALVRPPQTYPPGLPLESKYRLPTDQSTDQHK